MVDETSITVFSFELQHDISNNVVCATSKGSDQQVLICTVWSEPLPVAWIFYDSKAIDWTSFGVSKLKRRLHRLIRDYNCQNATLLEITAHLYSCSTVPVILIEIMVYQINMIRIDLFFIFSSFHWFHNFNVQKWLLKAVHFFQSYFVSHKS